MLGDLISVVFVLGLGTGLALNGVGLGFGIRFCQVFVSRRLDVRLKWLEFVLGWSRGCLDLNQTSDLIIAELLLKLQSVGSGLNI